MVQRGSSVADRPQRRSRSANENDPAAVDRDRVAVEPRRALQIERQLVLVLERVARARVQLARLDGSHERELPCLLKVLEGVDADLLVIDGYVWFDANGRKGLGAHLREATGKPVVGIAKTAFDGSPMAAHVLRGASRRPLYVTQVNVPDAAERVRAMHGSARIPTLVALADRLTR
jgi:deoxyribonuclease V